jgi:hypothetical protein
LPTTFTASPGPTMFDAVGPDRSLELIVSTVDLSSAEA